MIEIIPKYPWCTGVPRPTILTNMDTEEALISYFTAPVCQTTCRTALIKLRGLVSVEFQSINDEANPFLKSGFKRDMIYTEPRGKHHHFLILFHNETIKAVALSLEELPGEKTMLDNVQRHYNRNFERG